MRYDSEHKQKTRETILKEAASIMRAVGPEGVGIKSIMAKAGLTHGGFYAHFQSKDDLIAEAVAMMFEERRQETWKKLDDGDTLQGLNAFIDNYLSLGHRKNLSHGCPLPALSADMPRLSEAARQKFAGGLEGLTGLLAQRLGLLGHTDPLPLARSILSEMIGAVALSRSYAGEAEADALLAATRSAVKARLKP